MYAALGLYITTVHGQYSVGGTWHRLITHTFHTCTRTLHELPTHGELRRYTLILTADANHCFHHSPALSPRSSNLSPLCVTFSMLDTITPLTWAHGRGRHTKPESRMECGWGQRSTPSTCTHATIVLGCRGQQTINSVSSYYGWVWAWPQWTLTTHHTHTCRVIHACTCTCTPQYEYIPLGNTNCLMLCMAILWHCMCKCNTHNNTMVMYMHM